MKSHVRSQLELALHVYRDAYARCAAIKPSKRDEMTISSRVSDEGISFLTLTLPRLGKDIEKCLANGVIDSTCFRSFKKHGAIPAFLQGMLSRVFDRVTGRILNEAVLDVSCIEGLRQITRTFKKLEMDCTQNRVRSTLDSFLQDERDLSEAKFLDEDIAIFCEVSTVLWDCLSDIQVRELFPKHGPGATSESISGNQKYVWKFWHDRLEPYFPLLDTAYTLGCYGSMEFENVTIVPEDAETPGRVVPVNKDQEGPRVIVLEPCCNQYTQQGLRSELYKRIEDSELSSGHVNFTDQGINRKLALTSSLTGELATIDLKGASDRVYHDLAIEMFNCNPDLKGAILACRSTHVKMPDGTVIGPLRKFASMGSALCFPVEAMYFYTICVVALLRGQNRPVTRSEIYKLSRNVYVYGDDILVPAKWAAVVVDHLQKYHCKVNMSKSFWTGKFRESCGMDAYDGLEITPTYIRHLRPNSKRQAKDVVSWVKTANLFAKRGYVATSSYMFDVCEKILGTLPTVDERSSALGRVRQYQGTLPSGENNKSRWNPDTHCQEIMAWIAAPVRCTDELGGYGALMKSLLKLNGKPVGIPDYTQQLGVAVNRVSKSIPVVYLKDFELREEFIYGDAPLEDDLQRSARHGAVTLKRRWVAA